VGVFIELVVYRRLRNMGIPFLLTMIASLGCMTVLQNALCMIFGGNIKYFSAGFALPSIFIRKYAIPGWHLVCFVINISILVVLLLILNKTRIGSEIQSVAANIELARLIGLNLDKVHIVTMILASVLATWVGIGEAVTRGINAYSGTSFMLVSIVIRALGGVRSTRGIIIAGLTYGIVENIVLLFVPSRWASSLAFAIFVIAVLIRSNPTTNAMESFGGGL